MQLTQERGKTMKTIFYFLFALLFAACGGSDNDTGDKLEEQLPPLGVSITDALTADCPNGGVVVNQGIDTNGNGKIDSTEITSSQKVCNGEDGIGLIKTYTGSFTSVSTTTNDLDISVLEIKGKPGTTFALAYWAFLSAPNLWTPCADGWLDSADYLIACYTSWTYGTVTFTGLPTGSTYLYRVDVYGEL